MSGVRSLRGERLRAALAAFEAALDVPDDRREAWLAERLGDDAEIGAAVRELLDQGFPFGDTLAPPSDGLQRKVAERVASSLEAGGGGGGMPALSGNESLGEKAPQLMPGMRIGRYRLHEEIGSGGMGVVWRASDQLFHEDVALKFLPDALAADRLAMLRLRREAKVLLRLSHKNIVRVRTIEQRNALTFLVEEYLQGPDLHELVEERIDQGERGLSVEEVLWVLREVVPAIRYAHEEGVTHRDIKPGNLMVDAVVLGQLGERQERVKLTDFGLAFVATSALTHITSYSPSGTLPYMAPELLMGGRPTPAADVYGLGATVYHLIAGHPPFSHGDLTTQVLQRAPEPLDSGDEDLDAAVAAALAKRPEDRPASAEEFLMMAFGELSPAVPERGSSGPVAFGAAALAVAAFTAWLFLFGPLATQSSEPESDGQAAAEVAAPTPPAPAPDPGPPARIELRPPFAGASETVYLASESDVLSIHGVVHDPRSSALEVRIGSRLPRYELGADGTFHIVENLPRGETVAIHVQAEGSEPLSFGVHLDAEPPRIALVEPSSERLETRDESLDLRVRLEEPNLESVRVGGRELARRPDGTWGLPGLPLAVGENRLQVEATDLAGNTATLELSIHRDPGVPTLAEVIPPDGTDLVPGRSVAVVLRFTEAVASVELEGIALALDGAGTRASAELVAPDELGPWTPRWTARGARGGELRGRLRYTIAEPTVRAPRGMEMVDDTPGRDRWARVIRDPRTGLAFVLIEPGSYFRGSPEAGARLEEQPYARVDVPRAFYLARTEVTRGSWRRFVEATEHTTTAETAGGAITRAAGGRGDWEESDTVDWRDPLPHYAHEPSDEHPVTTVSWDDAVAYCEHYGYRLPGETEWEYACRAGSDWTYWWGEAPEEAAGRGNFADASAAGELSGATPFPVDDEHPFTAPVGSFEPNAWGLHDMLVNVWEWCAGGFDPTGYGAGAAADPEVETRPRVLRGGSWLSSPADARCARRAYDLPHRSSDVNGFRPVLEVTP